MIALPLAVFRLALATIFGALLGIEREWRAKNAGIKTNALVALGAAGFALMTDTFGPGNHNPAPIAAAVGGGIGFIGAGVILHRGATVQGVTTAATLWANASMGLAAGLGQINVALVIAAGILVVQFLVREVERMIRRVKKRTAPGRFELRVDCDRDAVIAVRQLWADCGLTITRRTLTRHDGEMSLRAAVRTAATHVDLTELEERIVAIEGVRLVEVRHLGIDED
jgi:putative Mg2+ transporter-C (MgtC) family protein